MNDQLSLSIFTIEVDRKPIFAIQSRKHSEAEKVLADENIRLHSEAQVANRELAQANARLREILAEKERLGQTPRAE